MKKIKILLVGCGKMGASLLEGWLSAGVRPDNIYVVEPQSAGNDSLQKLKVNVFADSSDLPEAFDFCVFAVKPQNFDEVVRGYNFISQEKCIFISIAAGKTIGAIQNLLGENTKIARCMPNLPATVKAGITAVTFNKNVTSEDQKQVIELLETIGKVVVIKDESKLDVITAISGSGPAYIFYIIEILAGIGMQSGLEKNVALELARSTVFGSGMLAMADTGKLPETLRKEVTSKGGTTEAALEVLMADKKLENLLFDAIKAATARAKELQ